MSNLLPAKLGQYCSQGDVDYVRLSKNPKHLFKFYVYKSAQLATAEGLARSVLERTVEVLFVAITEESSRCPVDLQLRARIVRPMHLDAQTMMELLSSIKEQGIEPKPAYKLFSTLHQAGLFRSILRSEVTTTSVGRLLDLAKQSLDFSKCDSVQIIDLRQIVKDFAHSRFPGVRSVEILTHDPLEPYSLEETLFLHTLFPNLTTLDIPAGGFSNDALKQLLDASKIDCLILHDAASFDASLLTTRNKPTTIFYVGDYPEMAPDTMVHADNQNNSQALILSKEVPEDVEDEARVYYDLYDLQDRHLEALIKYAPTIEEFKITRSPDLTDRALLAFVKKFPEITALGINGCPKVSEPALRKIAAALKNLTWVDLSGVSQVTDATLFAFFGECQQLHTWFLAYCPNITDRSLCKIISRSVYILDIVGCPKVSDQLALTILRNPASVADLRFCATNFSEKSIALLRNTVIKLEEANP